MSVGLVEWALGQVCVRWTGSVNRGFQNILWPEGWSFQMFLNRFPFRFNH